MSKRLNEINEKDVDEFNKAEENQSTSMEERLSNIVLTVNTSPILL